MKASSLLTQDPRTKKRNSVEKRFRALGLSAIVIALAMLVWLLISIVTAGSPAFRQAFLTFPVLVDETIVDKAGPAVRDYDTWLWQVARQLPERRDCGQRH